MAYLDVFIDGFAYFFLFPYIIYDHLKCGGWLRATPYLHRTCSTLVQSYQVVFQMMSLGSI